MGPLPMPLVCSAFIRTSPRPAFFWYSAAAGSPTRSRGESSMADEVIRKKIKWPTKRRKGSTRVWKTKTIIVKKKAAKKA